MDNVCRTQCMDARGSAVVAKCVRQRNLAWVVCAAAVLTGAATRSSSLNLDADTLTCKSLRIVDSAGKVRILATVTSSGQATIGI